MERALKSTSIILAFISIVLLPLTIWGAVFVAAGAMVIAAYYIKNSQFTAKMLQVCLITFISAAVLGVFSLIIILFSAFGELCGAGLGYFNFFETFNSIISIIAYLFALVFFILTVIMFINKKDAPVLNSIANKILNASSKAKQSKNESKENNEVNETVVETTAEPVKDEKVETEVEPTKAETETKKNEQE